MPTLMLQVSIAQVLTSYIWDDGTADISLHVVMKMCKSPDVYSLTAP